tara:strand:+ start:33997 stop:36165 length:2169 start_codon:yes stop_codon:yes gene_type:complete
VESNTMDVINKSKLLFAPLVGRMGFPGHSLSLIVKGVFDLKPDAKATISDEQLFPTGNELYEDDDTGTGSSRYESDFAYFKPRSDLLLVGKCHTPDNKPVRKCRVTFQVGDKSKSLDITGDRYKQGAFNSISDTTPFTSLELRYENSHGGVDNKKNPVGKGEDKSHKEGAAKLWLLANIDNTQRLSEPAGFGPLGNTWKDRASKMGTYKSAWLKERWPWFPKDFDWAYFNAAPTDMQVEGYLKGDESLFFENLHPTRSQFHTQLPGMRIRLFINELKQASNDTHFKEVSVNLDTLWVDMEAEKLVLVWRGISPVQTEDYEEIQHIFICSEPLNESAKSIGYYHDYFLKELIEEDDEEEQKSATDDINIDAELAEAEKGLRAALLAEGLDPDNLPEPTAEQKLEQANLLNKLGIDLGADPLTAEQFMAQFQQGAEFVDHNLQSLDLSERDLRSVNLHSSILAGSCFKRSNLSGAMLSECDLSNADLSGANLQAANLKDADLTGANLDGADLTGALLDDAIFEKSSMQNAVLEDVSALRTNFSDSNLKKANFATSNLKEADFSKSILEQVGFQNADLFAASFIGASGHAVNMTGADISELRASGGCDFSHGVFTKTEGKESIWEGANLSHADFSYSNMSGSDFSSANLTSANLCAADMRFSRFTKSNMHATECIHMNLFQGSLEKAQLKQTNFKGASLYGVEFLDALIQDTNFQFANLKMTKLS